MLLTIVKNVDRKTYEAVQEILNNSKFSLLTVIPEEGLTNEINNNLSNEELFNLHRKFRKKYFKLRPNGE